jgi:hypothetical protein
MHCLPNVDIIRFSSLVDAVFQYIYYQQMRTEQVPGMVCTDILFYKGALVASQLTNDYHWEKALELDFRARPGGAGAGDGDGQFAFASYKDMRSLFTPDQAVQLRTAFETCNGAKDCLEQLVAEFSGAFKKPAISKQLKAMGLARGKLTSAQEERITELYSVYKTEVDCFETIADSLDAGFSAGQVKTALRRLEVLPVKARKNAAGSTKRIAAGTGFADWSDDDGDDDPRAGGGSGGRKDKAEEMFDAVFGGDDDDGSEDEEDGREKSASEGSDAGPDSDDDAAAAAPEVARQADVEVQVAQRKEIRRKQKKNKKGAAKKAAPAAAAPVAAAGQSDDEASPMQGGNNSAGAKRARTDPVVEEEEGAERKRSALEELRRRRQRLQGSDVAGGAAVQADQESPVPEQRDTEMAPAGAEDEGSEPVAGPMSDGARSPDENEGGNNAPVATKKKTGGKRRLLKKAAAVEEVAGPAIMMDDLEDF